LILINNKIIYFLLVQKKEKFINVQNYILINFWIHSMPIRWLFMQSVGIYFIRKSLSVVQLIGLLKSGMLISSKNFPYHLYFILFSLELLYLFTISVVLSVMLHGHLIHQQYLLHVQLMEKFMYLI